MYNFDNDESNGPPLGGEALVAELKRRAFTKEEIINFIPFIWNLSDVRVEHILAKRLLVTCLMGIQEDRTTSEVSTVETPKVMFDDLENLAADMRVCIESLTHDQTRMDRDPFAQKATSQLNNLRLALNKALVSSMSDHISDMGDCQQSLLKNGNHSDMIETYHKLKEDGNKLMKAFIKYCQTTESIVNGPKLVE